MHRRAQAENQQHHKANHVNSHRRDPAMPRPTLGRTALPQFSEPSLRCVAGACGKAGMARLVWRGHSCPRLSMHTTPHSGCPVLVFPSFGGRDRAAILTSHCLFSTPHPRLPASSAAFHRFPFAPRFPCRYIGTCLTLTLPVTCSQPTIALRWFSEISELSTVFR